MLYQLTLTCNYPKEVQASYNWGSLLHGALMQLLPVDAADALHSGNVRAFSQHIWQTGTQGQLEWHLCTWDKALGELLCRTLSPITQLPLLHKGITLCITHISVNRQPITDFIGGFYGAGVPNRYHDVVFITPCTHKQAGQYVLFPSPELIMQNLCIRFSAFSKEFSFDDPQVMADLGSNCTIRHYNLRSASFSLEGTRIPGYMGRMTMTLKGPEPLVRLGAMILHFANYAGIGIKTSLGMGACTVAPHPHIATTTHLTEKEI